MKSTGDTFNGTVVDAELLRVRPAEEEEPLSVIVGNLKERVVALEAQAHNQHSIAPEVIESIVQQAARRAVQQVAAHLRKTADILEALDR